MSNLFLLPVAILTVVAGLLLVLHRTKVFSLKNNNFKIILYFVLIIGIIYISLSVFGGPLLEKIDAYREGVLQKSEEECKSENAPYWCDL